LATLARGLELVALVAPAAEVELGFHEGRVGRIFGIDADHATGGRTIQGCRGAAYDLDALYGAEVDVIGAALAAGQGHRDAVRVHLEAANAEAGTGAEAADGHAQVLREVVAVLHHQTRHAGQGLVEAKFLAAQLDVIDADEADGERQLAQLVLAARARDDDFLQL